MKAHLSAGLGDKMSSNPEDDLGDRMEVESQPCLQNKNPSDAPQGARVLAEPLGRGIA